MGVSFVTTNSGGNHAVLTDTKSEQVTQLPGALTCFGWEVDFDDPCLITAIEKTAVYITHNGGDEAPDIKITDDENDEVIIIKPGKRYPERDSHPLKAGTSLLVSLVANGNKDVS